jgi:hypothetical protein
MPCSLATGQAAGVAAALSVSQQKRPADLDPDVLRDALRKQEVVL